MTEKKGLRKVIDIILLVSLIVLAIQFFTRILSFIVIILFAVGCIFLLALFPIKVYALSKAFSNGYRSLEAMHRERYALYFSPEKDRACEFSTLIDNQGKKLLIVGNSLLDSRLIQSKKKQEVLNTMGKIHNIMNSDFVPYS